VPAAEQHLAQARHNEALSIRCQERYPDWAITAMFYAALHLLEAHFAGTAGPGAPSHYVNHDERRVAVRTRVSSDAYRRYRFLEDSSRTARYLCPAYTAGDAQVARSSQYEPLREALLRTISGSETPDS
jgi:hypothetical protein